MSEPANSPKATHKTVAAAILHLICQKQNPTQEKIHAITGGSLSTIKKVRDEVLAAWEEAGQVEWPEQIPPEFIEAAAKMFSSAKAIAWQELEEFKADAVQVVDSSRSDLKEANREIKNLQGQVDGCLQEISATETRNIELENTIEGLRKRLSEEAHTLNIERARWHERSLAAENQKQMQDQLIDRMMREHAEQKADLERVLEFERERYEKETGRLMVQVDDLKQQKKQIEDSARKQAVLAESSSQIAQTLLEQKTGECHELRANITHLTETLARLTEKSEGSDLS